jgi:hypothetical protein
MVSNPYLIAFFRVARDPGSISTAMLKMPPGFNSEIVSKRGSGQFRKLDHKNCLKTGVHSMR